jgi:hypothetical protein
MKARSSSHWRDVVARRLARSFLVPRGDDLVDVVRALGGVQAQVQASAELQVAARVDGITRDDVHRALWEDRTLAKAWTIRGTLHIHAADELALWLALAEPTEAYDAWRGPRGSLPALGADEVRKARKRIWAALDGHVLTREELAEAVGSPARERLLAGFGFFVDGLCHGPPRGQRITLARPDQWVAEWRAVTREEAIREAARRYVQAFAPVRPGAVQEWLGTRAEFEEIPPEFPEPKRSVRLVPEYDAYVMGFRERDQLVSPPVRALVQAHNRGRYEGPAGVRFVLADGIAAGLWERKKQGRRIEVTVTLARRVARKALEQEAERIGAFLGAEPVLTVLTAKRAPR